MKTQQWYLIMRLITNNWKNKAFKVEKSNEKRMVLTDLKNYLIIIRQATNKGFIYSYAVFVLFRKIKRMVLTNLPKKLIILLLLFLRTFVGAANKSHTFSSFFSTTVRWFIMIKITTNVHSAVMKVHSWCSSDLFIHVV